MCFSASASFGAGAVLVVIGTVTVTSARKPVQWLFAAIPFIFGIQQVSEGFTWLALQNTEYAKWQAVSIAIFLFFAHMLWPVWIPLSLYVLEEKQIRKKMLLIILCFAVMLSLSEIYCFFAYPEYAVINERHIDYEVHFPPAYTLITEVFYLIVTLVPCFLSSVKKMWWFGYSLTLTLVMSALFYKIYLISVWCFFAAITSVVIYFILKGMSRLSAPVIV